MVMHNKTLYWVYYEKHGDYEVAKRVPIVEEKEICLPVQSAETL